MRTDEDAPATRWAVRRRDLRHDTAHDLVTMSPSTSRLWKSILRLHQHAGTKWYVQANDGNRCRSGADFAVRSRSHR